MPNLGDAAHGACDKAIIGKNLCHSTVGKAADAADYVVNSAQNGLEEGKKAAGNIVGKALEGPINDFLISLWTGAVNFFQTFISSWIHAGPVISLEKDTMDWMKVATGPMVWICAVIGILIAGGKAMWNARGDDLRLMMQSLARVMIVSTGGSAFIAWMITASDSMAGWILKMAQWDKLNVKEALLKDPAAFVASAGAMSIIFSGIMVLVVLIQWILMIIRALVLPIIVLFWPISEAMNMAAGVPRFSRASRWILAFLLFKPTVAILYAFAFTLLKSQDGIGGPVMAVAVVTISIFALPFILKIVMPLSTAIGAGGGGDELIAVGKLALAAAAAGATAGAGAWRCWCRWCCWCWRRGSSWWRWRRRRWNGGCRWRWRWRQRRRRWNDHRLRPDPWFKRPDAGRRYAQWLNRPGI